MNADDREHDIAKRVVLNALRKQARKPPTPDAALYFLIGYLGITDDELEAINPALSTRRPA